IPLAFLGLIYSFLSSGYHYQFDIDEFFYAQFTYLYAHGFRPYLDVYTSVYPPLFSWIIMPIFWLKGFTFDALYAVRVLMITLLCIRLACCFSILRTVFSKRTAFIFLPLFLFDPFAVFTTMQVRPDNFMLTFFTIGLLFFTQGLVYNRRKPLVLSGLFFGIALLFLTKIIPSLSVLGIVFLFYCIAKRRLKDFVLCI